MRGGFRGQGKIRAMEMTGETVDTETKVDLLGAKTVDPPLGLCGRTAADVSIIEANAFFLYVTVI